MAPREVAGAGPEGRAQEVGLVQAPLGGQVRHDTRTPTASGATPGTTTTSSSTCRRSSSPFPRASVTEDEKGDLLFDRTKMTMTATTYDEMRKGCWDREERIKDLRAQLHGRLAALPDVPALLRPDLLREQGQGARPRLRQGEQRLDGRGVVRPLGRLQHPAVHHPAVGRRAGGGRDQAQRRAGRAGDRLQRDPDPPEAPEHQHRLLGPALAGLQRLRRDRVHARRVVVLEPGRLSGLAGGRGGDAWASTTPWPRWPTGSSRAT